MVQDFNIPSGSHDNHTFADLKLSSGQQVDMQVPFFAQESHVQKTVTYKVQI